MIKVEKQNGSNVKKVVLVPDDTNLSALGEFYSYPDEGFYVTLGHIGNDSLCFDQGDWDSFVKFVNEIDVLVREQNNG